MASASTVLSIVLLSGVLAMTGCTDKNQHLSAKVDWIQANRSLLAKLVDEIQSQGSLRRVIWSDRREFVTVIYRDDRIIDGYLDDNNWTTKEATEITDWIARLKSAGCHGFDDNGPAEVTRLFVSSTAYIGIPSGGRFSEQYAEWAKNDRNDYGYRCIDLGNGWYLTSQKH
jgi:hypothetical protein